MSATRLTDRLPTLQALPATHALPLGVLAALDLFMLRRLLLAGGLPAGSDSAFLYSVLPVFTRHGLGLFSAWLPTPLGEVQQYSVYWALTSVASVVGHPLLVYRAAIVATVLATTIASYGLAYWLWRSRVAAALASLLYSFAPFAVAQWLDGHLNVQIAYALGPAAIWALWASLRTGGALAAVALGFCGAGLFLLTTGQGSYWLVPLAAVAVVEVVLNRPPLVRVVDTLMIGLGTFLVASAVQLVPYLVGLRAPFTQGGGSYYIEQLGVHEKYSLGFGSGVLGVPRELYLPAGDSIGASLLQGWPIATISLVVVVVAFGAAVWTRRAEAVLLMLLAVAIWFVAAGPRGPAGTVYVLLYDHVPYLRFLRVPNRWLMVSTLSLSLLAGLAVAAAAERARSHPGRFARRLPLRLTILIVAAVAGGSTRAFTPGLTTWQPPAAFAGTYAPLARQQSDWRILTTPFFQSWMTSGTAYRNGNAIIADLGDTSGTWHQHAVLARGGWDPRAARFTTYLYELVKQGTTRSLAKLLGAIDVKYVGLDPQGAREVVSGQNPFFRRQHGLIAVSARGRVRLLENRFALPQAFVGRDSCVVAGGLHVLDDLARQRWFSFGSTQLLFADQLLATSGKTGLRLALAVSRCLVATPGGLQTLRILTGAAARVDLGTVAPLGWTRSQASPILDAGAEPSTVVDAPSGASVHMEAAVRRSGRYRISLSALHAPAQPVVRVSVDGRPAARIVLAEALGSAYRWTSSAPIRLASGRHSIDLSVDGSRIAPFAHLEQLAVVRAGDSLGGLLRRSHVRLVREVGGVGPVRVPSIRLGSSLVRGRWRAIPAAGRVKVVRAGAAGLSLRIRGSGRRYYTLARAPAAAAVTPSRPFALRFRGTGSRRLYYLNFLFSGAGAQVGYRFVDTSRRWRTLLFSPLQPTFTTTSPDWSHLRAITFSSNTKRATRGTLALAGPFRVDNIDLAPRFRSPRPLEGRAAATVALRDRNEPVRTSVPLRARLPRGTLVLTQSFNPDWVLDGETAPPLHTVALGFANGYLLTTRLERGTLVFSGASIGRAATIFTILGSGAIVVWLVVHETRRRRRYA